jgi:hypothetical protein
MSYLNPQINAGLLTKIVDIGDWNMDTTASVSVAHGLNNADIRSVQVIIRNDANNARLNLASAGTYNTTSSSTAFFGGINTNIKMDRQLGGLFDSANYDATSFNRGWIVIQYIP